MQKASKEALNTVMGRPALIYEFLGTAFQVYGYNLGYELRAYAYFIGWILAYHVSGAEFNPAISIASFFAKGDYSKGKQLLQVLAAQLLGAFFGVLLVFILLKELGGWALKPTPGSPMYTDLITLDIYWGRLLMHETFLTFVFGLIYLIIRFEPAMRKTDRLIKGLGACFTLMVCLSMSAGSGGCLNPAIGIAESIYMIGIENKNSPPPLTLGSDDAKFMWVYIIGPFIGAGFSALFFKLHDFIERNEYTQKEPQQFVGLLKSGSNIGNQLLLSGQDNSPAFQQVPQNELERSKVWSQLHNNSNSLIAQEAAAGGNGSRHGSALTLGGVGGVGSRHSSLGGAANLSSGNLALGSSQIQGQNPAQANLAQDLQAIAQRNAPPQGVIAEEPLGSRQSEFVSQVTSNHEGETIMETRTLENQTRRGTVDQPASGAEQQDGRKDEW